MMGLLQICKNLLYQAIVRSGIINIILPYALPLLGEKIFDTEKTFNYLARDKSGNTMRLTKVDGKIYPPFHADQLRNIRDIEVREDDLFLVGYPKTGAHFAFEIMRMLITGKRALSAFGKDFAGFVDPTPNIVIDSFPSPRILNSHLRYEELPKQIREKRTKIVLTVRNPKDTVVSYFNHHKIFDYHYDGDFDDHFDLFMSGNIDYGSYFDHLLSWDTLAQTPPSNNPILMVSFEEMKLKPVETVKRIAEFLEVDVSDSDVDQIIEVSKFTKMKAKRAKDMTAKIYRKGIF